MRKICEFCKYYMALGMEDSGLRYDDGTAWEYVIGQCINEKSVHGGLDPLPGKRTGGGRVNLPAWTSCEHWRKRKGGQK